MTNKNDCYKTQKAKITKCSGCIHCSACRVKSQDEAKRVFFKIIAFS